LETAKEQKFFSLRGHLFNFATENSKAMSLKTVVKINRITNLTDARYCSGMHADILGFCLEPSSPTYITGSQFQEITGWIAGIDYAAEFAQSTAAEITALLPSYPGISWIESEHLDALLQLKDLGLGLIYKVSIEQLILLPELKELLAGQNITLHLTSSQETITTEHQYFIDKLSSFSKVLLGFGIQADNASKLSTLPGVHGLALDGGDEIKPGLRDFDQLADILESLELDN
jgi:phosphoribosylanthranilate isomerase